MDCVFCQIICGNKKVAMVYEDEKFVAFLDQKPLATGHTLLCTKQHYANVFDIPADLLGDLARLSQKLSLRVKSAMMAEGITLWQNNEKAGGQHVMHYHMHIIPRFTGDRFSKEVAPQSSRIQAESAATTENLERIAAKIRAYSEGKRWQYTRCNQRSTVNQNRVKHDLQ